MHIHVRTRVHTHTRTRIRAHANAHVDRQIFSEQLCRLQSEGLHSRVCIYLGSRWHKGVGMILSHPDTRVHAALPCISAWQRWWLYALKLAHQVRPVHEAIPCILSWPRWWRQRYSLKPAIRQISARICPLYFSMAKNQESDCGQICSNLITESDECMQLSPVFQYGQKGKHNPIRSGSLSADLDLGWTGVGDKSKRTVRHTLTVWSYR